MPSRAGHSYVRWARHLTARWWRGGGVVPENLDPAAIITLVRDEVERLAAPSARNLLSALRSFLRFLYVTGRTSDRSGAPTRRRSAGRRLPSPADGSSCRAYAGSLAVLALVPWVVPWVVPRGARSASRLTFQVTGKTITDKEFKMSKKLFGTDYIPVAAVT